jgi:hypothetical protein
MKIKGIAFLCLGAITTQLSATVIYTDGNTHTIDYSIYDNVVLENYSDLNIVEGGSVITSGSDPAINSTTTPATGTDGSTVNMSGNALVIGGIQMGMTGNIASSVITRDKARIIGGVSGAHYIEVNDNSRIEGGIHNGNSEHFHVAVNGGEVVGESGNTNGGTGVIAEIDPIYLTMTGGAISGGYGDQNGGTGVLNTNYGSVEMTGGAIYGGDGGVNGGDAIYSYSMLKMDIYGGQIQGGDGGDFGGSGIVTNASEDETTNIQIFDGQFDAGLGSIDDGWIFDISGSGSNMSIYGGQIGYDSVGAGINIDYNGLLNIYGWDLKLVDDLLTGYLLDGSWIETPVTVANIYSPDRGLHLFNNSDVNVPEPSVLLLMLSGLAGVSLFRLNNRQSA